MSNENIFVSSAIFESQILTTSTENSLKISFFLSCPSSPTVVMLWYYCGDQSSIGNKKLQLTLNYNKPDHYLILLPPFVHVFKALHIFCRLCCHFMLRLLLMLLLPFTLSFQTWFQQSPLPYLVYNFQVEYILTPFYQSLSKYNLLSKAFRTLIHCLVMKFISTPVHTCQSSQHLIVLPSRC